MNILLYVQHLLGIGHVRRAALLAQAMTARGDRVTVAYGGFPVPQVDFGTAVVKQLPPARVANADFAPILNANDRPIDAKWKAERAAALLDLYDAVQPDCLVVETFPFGRRAFRFELNPLLDRAHARRPRPLIACSVRDILVAKDDPAKEAAMADTARRWFDLVLVHGDPAIVPFADSFPYADRINDLIVHTGFIAPRRPERIAGCVGADGTDEIIVSVGGGAVGLRLLETACSAAAEMPASWASHRWRLLVGPDIPVADLDRLRQQAPNGVTVERARPDFTAMLSRCALSISQAGYNTVMDVLVAGCRALFVPFAQAGESEQTRRAELVAVRGWAQCLPEADLTAASLVRTIDRCMSNPKPDGGRSITLSGAETSIDLLHQKFIGLQPG